MKIIGITRVRNEELVIKNTLDHVSQFVDEILVFNDASTDNTRQICVSHVKVKRIYDVKIWDNTTEGRAIWEGRARNILYNVAISRKADWIYCFDADEYADLCCLNFNSEKAYYLRLFDFYITPEDVDKNYLDRKWMGPEYRDIPMLFHTSLDINFRSRVPQGGGMDIAKFGGYVKHYGKAISVEEWDKDCDYYSKIRWGNGKNPELAKRWEDRKGKAIHTVSDFGRPLITWDDRKNNQLIVKI